MRLPVVVAAVCWVVGMSAAKAQPPKPAKRLAYADFWKLAGITRADSVKSVVKKLGKPKHRTATSVRYANGPSILFEDDAFLGYRVQFDYSVFADPKGVFAKKHAARTPGLALVGMACEAAAKRLAFTNEIKPYTTCKHYDANGWMLDVTLTCTQDEITGLTVVWAKYPPEFANDLPADHCN